MEEYYCKNTCPVWPSALRHESASLTGGWVKCYLEPLWLQALSESQPPMYDVSWNNWVKRVEIATLKSHIWLMSPAFPCSTGANAGINEYLLTLSASVSWNPYIFGPWHLL